MDNRLMIIASVALGGACGAVLRYSLSGFVNKSVEGSFPLGTFSVNLLGAFMIGVLWSLGNDFFSDNAKSFLFTGFLGALTTFSTYSLETVNLHRENKTVLAAANIAANNIACMAAVLLGVLVARQFMSYLK